MVINNTPTILHGHLFKNSRGDDIRNGVQYVQVDS